VQISQQKRDWADEMADAFDHAGQLAGHQMTVIHSDDGAPALLFTKTVELARRRYERRARLRRPVAKLISGEWHLFKRAEWKAAIRNFKGVQKLAKQDIALKKRLTKKQKSMEAMPPSKDKVVRTSITNLR
jgi:hypothetical protein